MQKVWHLTCVHFHFHKALAAVSDVCQLNCMHQSHEMNGLSLKQSSVIPSIQGLQTITQVYKCFTNYSALWETWPWFFKLHSLIVAHPPNVIRITGQSLHGLVLDDGFANLK